jgi:polysaccharide export outer membrane protein
LRVFAAILATAALAGCAAPPGEGLAPAPQAVINTPPPRVVVNTPPPRVVVNAPAPPVVVNAPTPPLVNAPTPPVVINAPTPDAAVGSPYRLASGDRVRIIVFGQSDLTNSYSVDSAGAISMPLIGRVPAQGLTTTELEGAVTAKLRQGYLRDPNVSIEVAEYRPFFILGAVASAGQYPYVDGLTVEQAVAAAGGFAPAAVLSSAAISRIVHGQAATFAAPLAYPVQPGDTITVEARAP